MSDYESSSGSILKVDESDYQGSNHNGTVLKNREQLQHHYESQKAIRAESAKE